MYKYISEQTIYQYFGDDDPEMIREMVQIILDTNIRDLQDLHQFLAENDFSTIKKRCHKAKPSMSYIGALKTRKILEEMEADLENASRKNPELQNHLTQIDQELNQFLKELK